MSWKTQTRAALAAFVVIAAAAASPAHGAVVINEVESDGGSDFIEIHNTGPGAVDIGNWEVRDNGAGTFTIGAPQSLAAGAYHVIDTPFGLGSNDSALLLDNNDVQINRFDWTSHAVFTYGRCPNGDGAFASTLSVTKGTANDCSVTVAWPGGSTISFADDAGVFGTNLSGLAYQPSGSAAPGVLWAVRNGPSMLYRLLWDGTKWTPDTANGWGAGKQLLYPGGTGVPDAESVTLASGDANAVYVSVERNDCCGLDNTSRPAVLRFDVSGAGAPLTATREWDLSGNLLGLDANAGLEAMTWVPDSVLVEKGFYDENLAVTYNPAAYPDHGSGLFFVGVEQTGQIVAYELDGADGTFTRVAAFANEFPRMMALEFETETGLLWAVCDNECDGRHATYDIAQSGPNDGRFVLVETFDRPAGMANLNNEGFAIAPRAECVNSRKPVFWSDDSNTAGHALRGGTVRCTNPPSNGGDGSGTGSGGGGGGTTTATTPTTTTTPGPITSLPPPVLTPRDTTRPAFLGLRASRRSVSFRLSERARVTITIERRTGRGFRRLGRFTITSPAGQRTVSFRRRVPASRLRSGRLRVTLQAADAAGNRSAAQRKLVG